MLYAFIWVLAYGMLYTLSKAFSDIIKRGWITPLSMLVFVCILMVWIFKTGRRHHAYLNLPKAAYPLEYLYILPLFLPALFNLIWAGGITSSLSTLILLLCAAVAEELLFRGFLLRFFTKSGNIRAIFFSSLLFALIHCVNIGEMGMTATLMQIVWAFSAGLLYAALTVRLGSILPCLTAHILTNITSTDTSSLWLWLSILIYLICAISLCIKIKENNK